MKVLSVSTATENLSVALNEDERVIDEQNEVDKRNHSEHLDPLIAEMLKTQQLKLQDIDRFAVAIGPGSYTGLRIGVTTVKMFASILAKPVVGISTLEALAAGCSVRDTLIIAGIDARNDNFFAGGYLWNTDYQLVNVLPDGHYHIDVLLAEAEKVLVANNLTKIIFVGSGFTKQEQAIVKLNVDYSYGTARENKVHAGVIGKLALTRPVVTPDELLPKYLRRTQAEVDWHRKTGQPFAADTDYIEEV